MRWSLTPFLVLFIVAFSSPIPELLEMQRYGGVFGLVTLDILCLAGLLALWGVPWMGRIVTAIIASACVWYVVDQCIFHFDGSWVWGGRKSAASPIHSILAFFIFGLPCLIYTLLGRFTWRKPPDHEAEAVYQNDSDGPANEEKSGPGAE